MRNDYPGLKPLPFPSCGLAARWEQLSKHRSSCSHVPRHFSSPDCPLHPWTSLSLQSGASFDLRAKQPLPLARGVQRWGLSLPGAGTAHPAAGAEGQPAVVSLTPVQPSSLRILDVRLGYFELGNGPAPLLQRGQQRRWI